MEKCSEDWKTCGHCKAAFGESEIYPSCDKVGFMDAVFGSDVCPNAPDWDTLNREKVKVKCNGNYSACGNCRIKDGGDGKGYPMCDLSGLVCGYLVSDMKKTDKKPEDVQPPDLENAKGLLMGVLEELFDIKRNYEALQKEKKEATNGEA